MQIKEIVGQILLENKDEYISDKELVWETWRRMGIIKGSGIGERISKKAFMKYSSFANITAFGREWKRGIIAEKHFKLPTYKEKTFWEKCFENFKRIMG